jgi:type 1 glutamine amidotransferase
VDEPARSLAVKRLLSVGLTLVTFCCLSQPAAAQKKAPGGAKVFLLSGGQRQHHGYRDQAFYLADALENTGRFEVTIGEDAAILETSAIRKYDLIIVGADRRDPEFKFTRGQQEALFDYVRSGHGYVSIHGADNAAADWLPTWKEMLGGVFSHFGLPDGKTRKGTFTVKIVDTSSPVTQGIKDFKIKDELYYQLQLMPDVRPLATVEYQGTDWPVAWTRTFGKGRVFHTTMGHRDFGPNKEDPLRDPNLSRLVVQGVEWVAAGRSVASKS